MSEVLMTYLSPPRNLVSAYIFAWKLIWHGRVCRNMGHQLHLKYRSKM